jgi:hypothetical protein
VTLFLRGFGIAHHARPSFRNGFSVRRLAVLPEPDPRPRGCHASDRASLRICCSCSSDCSRWPVALFAISAALFCVFSKAGVCRRGKRSSLSSKGPSDEGEPPDTSTMTVDTTFGTLTGIIDGRASHGRPVYTSLFEDTLIDDARASP